MRVRKNRKHVCLSLIEELYIPFKEKAEAEYMNVSSVFNRFMAETIRKRGGSECISDQK